MVTGLGFFFGCSQTVNPNLSDFGFDYYPIEKGQYRIYYTRLITYSLDGSVDTTNYLTKEVVEDSITYVDGSARMLLGRYSADLGTNEWKKDSLWLVNVTTTNIVVSEANVDYIKLAFPVEEKLSWDGNAFNSRDEEIYELNNLNTTYEYDTLSYESALTVVHADLIDPAKLTSDDYRIEVYAKGVGLVHKLKKQIHYCDPTRCSENGTIDDGIIFEQKLIEFGKE